jgi:23S rRNA-/tRNA-specific pseudouridylate synthase
VKRAPVLVVCKNETAVDAVLPRLGPGAAEALAEGRIFIGKRRAAPSDLVRAGDEIWMYPARPVPRDPPRVLLDREGIVAVDKPPDMATVADHRGAAGSLETAVARLLGRKGQLTATSRLDVGVSGVVVLAADDDARRRLAQAREEGRYLRHYVAVASRAPAPERGVWTSPIGRARNPRLRQVGGASAVHAETRYALAATAERGVLLAVEPQTGRTHQIRVHAAHAGCALWGDEPYGGPTRFVAPTGAIVDVARIALHAAWVEVPLASGVTRIEAPIPPDFSAVWTLCGGDLSAFAAARAPVYVSTR